MSFNTRLRFQLTFRSGSRRWIFRAKYTIESYWKMCILKLLRLQLSHKHKRHKSRTYINASDFYGFSKLPLRCSSSFPEFVMFRDDGELDATTLTTSLIDSMCSDALFKGSRCNCKAFHERLRETEKRWVAASIFLCEAWSCYIRNEKKIFKAIWRSEKLDILPCLWIRWTVLKWVTFRRQKLFKISTDNCKIWRNHPNEVKLRFIKKLNLGEVVWTYNWVLSKITSSYNRSSSYPCISRKVRHLFHGYRDCNSFERVCYIGLKFCPQIAFTDSYWNKATITEIVWKFWKIIANITGIYHKGLRVSIKSSCLVTQFASGAMAASFASSSTFYNFSLDVYIIFNRVLHKRNVSLLLIKETFIIWLIVQRNIKVIVSAFVLNNGTGYKNVTESSLLRKREQC